MRWLTCRVSLVVVKFLGGFFIRRYVPSRELEKAGIMLSLGRPNAMKTNFFHQLCTPQRETEPPPIVLVSTARHSPMRMTDIPIVAISSRCFRISKDTRQSQWCFYSEYPPGTVNGKDYMPPRCAKISCYTLPRLFTDIRRYHDDG